MRTAAATPAGARRETGHRYLDGPCVVDDLGPGGEAAQHRGKLGIGRAAQQYVGELGLADHHLGDGAAVGQVVVAERLL